MVFIYTGLSAAAAGSAPGAALFFSTYETTKNAIHRADKNKKIADPFVHMIAACLGEVVRYYVLAVHSLCSTVVR